MLWCVCLSRFPEIVKSFLKNANSEIKKRHQRVLLQLRISKSIWKISLDIFSDNRQLYVSPTSSLTNLHTYTAMIICNVDHNLYLSSPEEDPCSLVCSHLMRIRCNISDAGFRMTEESSPRWFPWGFKMGSWPDDTANSTLHLCFFSEESDNATASDPEGLLWHLALE